MDVDFSLTGYDKSLIEPALGGACPPVMYTLPIRGEQDLATKLVKSRSAFIELPELDIKLMPGKGSRDMVCDVYGLLSRLEGVIKMESRIEARRKAEILARIGAIKEGRDRVTLVLIDPTGLSMIMGDAQKELLNT